MRHAISRQEFHGPKELQWPSNHITNIERDDEITPQPKGNILETGNAEDDQLDAGSPGAPTVST